MHFNSIWNSILNNGCHEKLNNFDKKRIRIINAFSFISALFALLFTIVLFYFSPSKLAIYDLVSCIVMGLPLYFNYKKKYKSAASISFIIVPLILLVMSSIYGKVGIEYYYFASIILVFYYHKKRPFLLAYTIYYILLFVAVKYFEATVIPMGITAILSPYFYYTNTGFALVITFIFLSLFTSEYESQQSELKKQNTELEKQNNIIQTLLKELNHRVKNNLQLVSSLLNLQLNNLKDPSAKKALEESKNRIISMALLHRMLYKEGNEMKVDMTAYIRELADYLKSSILNLSEKDIFEINVKSFFLPLEKSVSIGLILNELITNAIKHGFTNSVTKKLLVNATVNSNNVMVLEVADNGKGFPEGFSFEKNSNFGLELVSSLVKQLSGTIEIQKNDMNRVILNLNI